jgi:hypothetical protein
MMVSVNVLLWQQSKGFAGEKYKANNNHEYGNAVKFRDHQQYLDIRGIYGED